MKEARNRINASSSDDEPVNFREGGSDLRERAAYSNVRTVFG